MHTNTQLTQFAHLFLENSGGPVWADWREGKNECGFNTDECRFSKIQCKLSVDDSRFRQAVLKRLHLMRMWLHKRWRWGCITLKRWRKQDCKRWWKLQKNLTSTVGRSWKTCNDAVVKISVCSWCRKIEMTVCYCSLLLLYCGSCECEWLGIKNLICLHCLWHYLFIFLFALLYFSTLYLSQY